MRYTYSPSSQYVASSPAALTRGEPAFNSERAPERFMPVSEVYVEWSREVAAIEYAAGSRGGNRLVVLDPALTVLRAMEILDDLVGDEAVRMVSQTATWTRVSRRQPFTLHQVV